ncbi:MAG: thiamine phosphate synthase, partial [Zetaproteobacteria bacterium]
VNADGLHLPSRMIDQVPMARQWLHDHGTTNTYISVSCHNSSELCRAEESGCNLVLLSPVFPTNSHPGRPALGVERFQALATRVNVPVIALGGITTENRKLLGGYGIAVISAIMHARDPMKAAELLRENG